MELCKAVDFMTLASGTSFHRLWRWVPSAVRWRTLLQPVSALRKVHNAQGVGLKIGSPLCRSAGILILLRGI